MYREKNTAHIIDAAKKEKYVTCICLVVNGTECLLTKEAGHVITEVTAGLPKMVLQQIIVVCTKTPNKLGLHFTREMLLEFGVIVPKNCLLNGKKKK